MTSTGDVTGVINYALHPDETHFSTTSMSKLSPASLEVWSQYCSIVEEYGPPRLALAAALRETINQCQNGQGVIYSHDIFAIAAELEAQ
jgi:hypothetical protein